MSEFIVIQVGQCGNQIGSALWPLILQEYNLGSDNTNKGNNEVQKSLSSFFNIKSQKSQHSYQSLGDLYENNVKARVICIDMEESVVNRFRLGTLKNIFDKKSFITNYPGSGNNWAEGFWEHGAKFKNKILNVIQYVVEQCDSLHGFLVLFSTGGGTGSGLGSYILNLLADYYPKVERFVSCVYPTGTEDVITCPYNMCFATQEMISHATCVFPVENRALLDIQARQGININFDSNISMFRPFEDLNSIIVNMLLHLTSGSRFPGSLNFDMNELNTNMVPFPKLKFLSTGFSPITYSSRGSRQSCKQPKTENFLSACSKNNQLIKLDPLGPKSVLLGTTLIGRGDYTITDMRQYVDKIQSKAKFTNWSKKAVKVGLCSVPPYKTDISMFSVFNTSAMSTFFEYIHKQFSVLYNKKAHIHHYMNIQGFPLDSFDECQSTLMDIIELYREMEDAKPVNIPRLPSLKQDFN
ncbi:unnamed protein product [Brassicogethes aeneus]|uniref:Tubulin/FtsZ GTPase domain-containing protein n=1 Tax=Brassicogethes aeneus TaxID=1431903 RepID=A0A9P0AYM6_BRAAE|nr:unnamed protein product [Brassicogethes aeneus]